MNVIDSVERKDCCGCSACVQICPEGCLAMKADRHGFCFPELTDRSCLDCGLCQRVCPVLEKDGEFVEPQEVYAVRNLREQVRMKSSSGGVFAFLAGRVLDEGGVVFAARFDSEWRVVHDCTERAEDLPCFMGSKYVQSDIGDCFTRARDYLKNGRRVLFVGTPCQIKALRLFLNKPYDKLTTVDFVCHGVPSPSVWRKYLEDVVKKNGMSLEDIQDITFRNKDVSWRRYSLQIMAKDRTIVMEDLYHNAYLRGFLKNLYLRPSCHDCHARNFSSLSDITVCDFWGVDNYHAQIDDNKGVSAVFVHNPSLLDVLKDEQMMLLKTDFRKVYAANTSISLSAKKHAKREEYLDNFSDRNFERYIKRFIRKSFSKRVKRVVRRAVAVLRKPKAVRRK